MENKVYFSSGVVSLQSDTNNLDEYVEQHLANVCTAMADQASYIFKDITMSAVYAAGTVTVTVPVVNFVANGYPGFLSAVSVPTCPVTLATPQSVIVYLIVKEAESTGTRDWYGKSGATVIYHPADTVTIAKTKSYRAEVGSSYTSAAGDVAYVAIASFAWDGAAISPASQGASSSIIWHFPGYAPAAAPHATTHLPSGTDPIQTAGQTASTSTWGAMPPESLDVLLTTVSDVVPAATSPFLSRVASANLSIPIGGARRTVTLDLLHDNSLCDTGSASSPTLGLNYLTGVYAGTSEKPARSDHIHLPTQIPHTITYSEVSFDASDLGTVLTPAKDFSSVCARIYDVRLYWRPSGSDMPMIECGWFYHPTVGGYIGAKAHLIAPYNKLYVELGAKGVCYISNAVITTMGLTPTWAGGYYPAEGTIVIDIIGMRI